MSFNNSRNGRIKEEENIHSIGMRLVGLDMLYVANSRVKGTFKGLWGKIFIWSVIENIALFW